MVLPARWPALVCLLLLAACPDSTATTRPPRESPNCNDQDRDGDGISACVDCNDADPRIGEHCPAGAVLVGGDYSVTGRIKVATPAAAEGDHEVEGFVRAQDTTSATMTGGDYAVQLEVAEPGGP